MTAKYRCCRAARHLERGHARLVRLLRAAGFELRQRSGALAQCRCILTTHDDRGSSLHWIEVGQRCARFNE